MSLERKRSGTACEKRNCWHRGKGCCSFRGELKRGLALNKKRLNRKVRHQMNMNLKGNGYRRVCRTENMVDFT